MVWVLYILAGCAALYALLGLAVQLEGRGCLYYRNRPSPGGGSPFLLEFVQPQIHHVIEAEGHRAAKRGEEDQESSP